MMMKNIFKKVAKAARIKTNNTKAPVRPSALSRNQIAYAAALEILG